MKKRLHIFQLSLLWLIPQLVYSQENWELKQNKNNIKIYTRLASDKKFKEVKVITELPGTSKELFNTVFDVENHKAWVYGVKQSYPVKKNNNSLVYYCEYELPFPVQNRDMILEMKILDDPKTKISYLNINSVNDNKPEKKNIIRITKLSASWEVLPLTDNKIKVTYILSVDPAGTIPALIYNRFVSEGPYRSFKNLQTRLQQ